MSAKNEKHVREFLDKFHEGAQPDFAALMAYFADDAHYQPLVPMRDPVYGKQAIREEIERQYKFYKECECKLHARSEEHTSELQSLMRLTYAVFCLKKKKK